MNMIKGMLVILLLYSILFTGESTEPQDPFDEAIDKLYQQLELTEKLDKPVFALTMVGYYNLKRSNLLQDDSILTIIDYKKPSREQRFFVINLAEKKLLYATYVAHGKGSGVQFAESFSNKPGSLKSSLGFFVTEESYVGRHGYSLKLQGVEPGINDNAMQRAIVIHGANYVSETFIQEYGRLGRSWGCPALPEDITRQVIDEIKGGSCLFVYSEDDDYLQKSTLLNRETAGIYYLEAQTIVSNQDTLIFKDVSRERIQPRSTIKRDEF